MMKKINALVVDGCCRVKGFLAGLKDDERGVDGIVIAVILILIGVLAAVAIWGSLSGWLSDLWSRITGSGDSIQGSGTLQWFASNIL